jgi:hypothetical protein
MKLNFLQQMGIVVIVIGIVLLGIYTQPVRPEFSLGGGVVTFRDVPEWLPGGTLFGGVAALVVGTIINMIRRRTGADDDEEESAE